MEIEQRCTSCDTIKGISLFHRNKRNVSGFSSVCKVCKSISDANAYKKDRTRIISRSKEYQDLHKAECAARMAAWNKANPERAANIARKGHLRRKYNLTVDEFGNLFSEQKNKCAICEKHLSLIKDTRIDHEHRSGLVRGILCHNCNALLGHARDDVAILNSAIKYLSDFRKKGDS